MSELLIPVDKLDLDEVAKYIHKRERQVACSQVSLVVEVGNILLDLKSRLDHGEFQAWCDKSFVWSARYRRMLMAAAVFAGYAKKKLKLVVEEEGNWTADILFLISKKNLEDSIKTSLLKRLKNGDTFTQKSLKEFVKSFGEDEETKEALGEDEFECCGCEVSYKREYFQDPKAPVYCKECHALESAEVDKEAEEKEKSDKAGGAMVPVETPSQDDWDPSQSVDAIASRFKSHMVSQGFDVDESAEVSVELAEMTQGVYPVPAFQAPAVQEVTSLSEILSVASPKERHELVAAIVEDSMVTDVMGPVEAMCAIWDQCDDAARREFLKKRNVKRDYMSTRFQPPSAEDVQEYVDTKKLPVVVEAFMAHYGANGWKVGSNRMKDWKCACRSWAVRAKVATGGRDMEDGEFRS